MIDKLTAMKFRLSFFSLCLLLTTTVVWAKTPECSLCRRTDPPHKLREFRYTEERSKTREVCEICVKKEAKCDVCRAPTKVKAAEDGRHICPDCTSVAIDTEAEIQALYLDVQRYVSKLTGKKVDSPPPIRLVQRDEMETRYAESASRMISVHAFYRAYNPEIIYVLSGHSASDLGPTLAHEYTHAWQSRHCPQQDRQVTEGFATWVGYKYAKSKRYGWKVREIKSFDDHDYGDGLDHCLKIEKKSGIKGLLKFVSKERAFK